MERTTLSKAGAMAAVALLLVSALPLPASAYPGTVNGFNDGRLNSTVEFSGPAARAFVGTVRLPSNGTVTGANITVEPGTSQTSLSFAENGSSGFPAGTASGGLAVSGGGLSLGVRSGVTTFSGAALDAGIFSGTVKSGDAVVLSSGSGSYETPLISWDGASYGRLIARVGNSRLGTVQFSVVSPAGAVLQSSVETAGVVSVDGATYPSVRVRADISAPNFPASPEILELGVGHAIVGSPTSGAATNALNGMALVGDSLQLATSRTNFSVTSANPLIVHTPSTWYAQQIGAYTAVVVGTELWLYVAARVDALPATPLVIGRAVSTDGGGTWTVDASPLMLPTAAAWDSGGVYAPVVIWDGGTGWQMWYNGYDAGNGSDYSRIGYATSTDGLNWTKYGAAPVMDAVASTWESQSLHLGGVVKAGPTYFLYYAARDEFAYNKKIGVATSADGIAWTRFAGNPFITPATAWYTDSEPYAGNAYYHDGTFYLYWASSSLEPPSYPGYATCLSTSTDGFNFTLDANNPIIWYGQNAWDYNAVEQLTETYNPLTGEALWLYTGAVFSPPSGDIGRAIPSRVSAGSFSAVWDLTGEMPRRINAVSVAGTVPPGTAMAPSLSSGSTDFSFAADEAVGFGGDATISTLPDNFLRLSLAASTSTPSETPTVDSIAIAYDRYLPDGAFESQATAAPHFIAGATVTLDGAVPAGTGVALQVSNDDGNTWEAATSGAPHAFASSGKAFRYTLALTGLSAATPALSGVRVTLALAVNPHDLVIETAGGERLASIPGELTGAARVSLDASVLNARIAPSAGSDPPVGVDIALFATSASPGLARFSNLAVDLSFPDELVTYFAPNASRVEVVEGRTALFRILASTTPGVAIHYSWSVDGTALPLLDANFTFGPQLVGNYTVRGAVTNGQFSDEFTWAVEVVPKPVPPAVKITVAFWPVSDLVIHVNDTVVFRANLTAAADPPVTYQWRILGGPVGHADTGNFTVVPTLPGTYEVWVTVRNAAGTESYMWNLTVLPIDAPGTNTGPRGGEHVAGAGAGDPSWLALVLLMAVAGAALAAIYTRSRSRNNQP